jgi:hypothetical protein
MGPERYRRIDAVPEKRSKEMMYAKPKYIVVCKEGFQIMMATHRLFSDQVTAYSYASTIHEDRCPIVVEVLKPLYEEEINQ